MFNKLLANLPFNPSLAAQISFYGKRLRQESSIRRIGFVFVALALVVQLFAVISPAQASLASSPNDLVNGGFTSNPKIQAVQDCNDPSQDYGIILAHYGITCGDVNATSTVTIRSTDDSRNLFSMGRDTNPKGGDQPVNIPGANGDHPLYLRPLWIWDTGAFSTYQALTGTTSSGLQFWLLYDCGNLVFNGIPTPPTTPTPPQQVLNCANLMTSFADGAQVQLNTKLTAQGQASGQNITAGQTVEMDYNYINAATGKVVASAQTLGVPFQGATATDGTTHSFTASSSGQFLVSLTVKDGSSVVAGSGSGSCLKHVSVAVPPPQTLTCSNLLTSFQDKADIPLGTQVTARGQADGQNIATGQTVDMYYDYVDAATGKVVASAQTLGVPFQGTTASDSAAHSFTTGTAGQFLIRLTVKNDSSAITGSASGNCVMHLTVQPACQASSTSQNASDCLVRHKSATNITQNTPGATKANAGDVIEYTLTTTNGGSVALPNYVAQDDISHILDYADITDYHGGSVDAHNYISWPAIDILPKQTVTNLLTVRVKSPIPATPVSTSDGGYFNNTLSNMYGDSVVISLPQTIVTVAQTVGTTLPNTGPGTSLIGAAMLVFIVGYFFARSRLLAKEADLVRRDYASAGGSL